MKPTKSDRRALAAFMAPALVMMLVFFVIPVLYVITVSVLKWNGISAPSFNGMKNFALLFKDKAFTRSIVNNVIWAFTAACIQVPLAMLMSIILSRKPKGWKFFRTVYFFPQVISGIALAMLWRGIYNADYGLLNGLLKAIGLGHLSCDWLGGLKTAFPAVLIYWVFYVGYYMVIMMADITTIDQSYYEAATIDGAGYWRRLFSITIPLLARTLEYSFVSAMIWIFTGIFPLIYSLSNGGPGYETTTLDYMVYVKGFNGTKLGQACALSVILLLIITAITVIQMRMSNRADDWR